MANPDQWESPAFLEQLRARQCAAWRTLYERYFASLASRFGEDIAQDTFSEACVSIVTFTGRAKLQSWLFQIARHLEIECYHKANKERATAQAFEQWLQGMIDHAPLEQRLDARKLLEAAVRLLTPREKALFLRYLAGESQRQIATSLGVSEGTVNVAVSRIRAGLRKELAYLWSSEDDVHEIV